MLLTAVHLLICCVCSCSYGGRYIFICACGGHRLTSGDISQAFSSSFSWDKSLLALELARLAVQLAPGIIPSPSTQCYAGITITSPGRCFYVGSGTEFNSSFLQHNQFTHWAISLAQGYILWRCVFWHHGSLTTTLNKIFL